MRETNLVQTKQYFTQYMGGMDRNLELEREWNYARFPRTENNPFIDDRPFSREEVLDYLKSGIANNPLLEFDVLEFSRDLVPASGLGRETDHLGEGSWGPWVSQREIQFYTWQENLNEVIPLEVTGGRIAH